MFSTAGNSVAVAVGVLVAGGGSVAVADGAGVAVAVGGARVGVGRAVAAGTVLVAAGVLVKAAAGVAVAARVQGSGHREQTTASLTLANLQQLLSAAHAQRLAEGYVPVLYSLELHYTRARLLADETAFVEVSYGPESYVIPVERRADGLWVAGPVRDAMLNPPIKVTLENNDGRLTLTVCAGWSAWVTSGSAETALFDSCLQALVEQGWEE